MQFLKYFAGVALDTGEKRVGGYKRAVQNLKTVLMEHSDCKCWTEYHNFFVLRAELMIPKEVGKIISDAVF